MNKIAQLRRKLQPESTAQDLSAPSPGETGTLSSPAYPPFASCRHSHLSCLDQERGPRVALFARTQILNPGCGLEQPGAIFKNNNAWVPSAISGGGPQASVLLFFN